MNNNLKIEHPKPCPDCAHTMRSVLTPELCESCRQKAIRLFEMGLTPRQIEQKSDLAHVSTPLLNAYKWFKSRPVGP